MITADYSSNYMTTQFSVISCITACTSKTAAPNDY